MPLCGAQRIRRPGVRCRQRAMANGRCRYHGGVVRPGAHGRHTPEGQKRVMAAMKAGFERYVAGMAAAKAQGLVDRFPWGRKPQEKRDVRGDDKLYETAEALVMAELKTLPAPSSKPFEEQTMGEQLATNTRLSLQKTHEILTMDIYLRHTDEHGIEHVTIDRRLLAMQKDAALSLIATQVKVDENIMRRQSADRLPDILRRIQAINAEAPLLENDEPRFIDFDQTA